VKLSDEAPTQDWFDEDKIGREIQAAETGLLTAFTAFVVGLRSPTLLSIVLINGKVQVNTGATQNRLQENLHQALEQDRQQFLLYADSLLKDLENRINAMPSLMPAPTRDSDESGDLTKRGDMTGGHYQRREQQLRGQGMP